MAPYEAPEILALYLSTENVLTASAEKEETDNLIGIGDLISKL